MLISPAFAQGAGGAQGGDPFGLILMFGLMIAVIYFLLIRPQQKRAKEHREMVNAVRRGDTVVTQGGIVGKVTRVLDDNEVQVEIADGVRVKILKATLSDVRSKSEPAEKKESPNNNKDNNNKGNNKKGGNKKAANTNKKSEAETAEDVDAEDDSADAEPASDDKSSS